MRFYTTEQLSANRELTPEGYLLCKAVPMARTGTMLYGPGEIPIKPAKGTQVVRVHRRPEDVFNPISMASYVGKPFCDDHPADDVIPKNWKHLTKGIVFDPRQGVGDMADVVLGDILITDPDVIEMVRDNDKVEISAGYDADYEEIAPGEGFQKNIIINHVALVADGRCGPRCRIGDANPKENTRMAKLHDLLLRAFKAKDAAEFENISKEADPLSLGGEPDGHHIHLHLGGGAATEKDEGSMNTPPPAAAGAAGAAAGGGGGEGGMAEVIALLKQLITMQGGAQGQGAPNVPPTGTPNEDAAKKAADEAEAERKRKEMEDDETISSALEMESPPGTDDRARKAKDSMYLADAWQTLVSQIEIVTPGARFPTFDSAARPAVTYTKICGMRTETLDRAYQRPELSRVIDAMNGGRRPDFKKMTCDAARAMIASVALEAGRLNNRAGVGDAQPTFGTIAARAGTIGGGGVKGAIATPADLNAMARKLYNRT